MNKKHTVWHSWACDLPPLSTLSVSTLLKPASEFKILFLKRVAMLVFFCRNKSRKCALYKIFPPAWSRFCPERCPMNWIPNQWHPHLVGRTVRVARQWLLPSLSNFRSFPSPLFADDRQSILSAHASPRCDAQLIGVRPRSRDVIPRCTGHREVPSKRLWPKALSNQKLVVDVLQWKYTWKPCQC